MVDFKIVISTKDGKSVQRAVSGSEAMNLVGKKIGDVVRGELIGLIGYELQITGGSDYCGFPMRRDVPGTGRKRILAVKGIGIKKKEKGIRQRKTVCGNTIHPKISQLNLKVVKEGKTPLSVQTAEGGEQKKEELKGEEQEEKKKKEEKAEAKKEAKAEEKKTEKPKEHKKEEKKGEN